MKYPKPKRTKRSPRKKLVAALDRLISIIVRTETPYCVICRKRENLTAGHVFTRTNYSTRWDLENVFTQCIGCNLRHEYDPIPFYTWFENKFGRDKLLEVYARWKNVRKFTDVDLNDLLIHLQERHG